MAIDYYKKQAHNYDNKWKQFTSKTLDKAIEKLPSIKNRKILDYGCGTGELIKKMILLEGDFQKIVGYDPSNEMLQKGFEKIRQFRDEVREKVELQSLNEFTEKFDIIVSTNTFHYFQNPSEQLKEFYNLLEDDGALIIVDYTKDSFPVKYFEWWIKRIDKAHQKAYTQEEIVTLLNQAGFHLSDEEKFKISAFWNGVIIKSGIKLTGN